MFLYTRHARSRKHADTDTQTFTHTYLSNKGTNTLTHKLKYKYKHEHTVRWRDRERERESARARAREGAVHLPLACFWVLLCSRPYPNLKDTSYKSRINLEFAPKSEKKVKKMYFSEQIELQAKLLNYFLGSNRSNMNQTSFAPQADTAHTLWVFSSVDFFCYRNSWILSTDGNSAT